MEASPYSAYHAVYVPLMEDDSVDDGGSKPHIYGDKNEALKVIKKYKNARLKSFKTLQEAQEFSRNGLESVLSNPLAHAVPLTEIGEEKSSNFKGPKPQQLVAFRKLVEKGDLVTVKNSIWENPRYLVSSGDTPTILQEGCRYNALHIAVKASKPESPQMCKLILDTVGDSKFVELFYGDTDKIKSSIDRASILQDLYLNMPDKGLNETPLHFATKFGLKECVQTLLSYPQCVNNPKNKYEQTPRDIICSRKFMNDKALINEIHSLFEDQYCVPILRAEDNSMAPTVGQLFSPTSPLKLNHDPLSPRIEVSAFAGPMSMKQAVEFRKILKTPPRIGTPNKKSNLSADFNGLKSPGLNSPYRLQDSEKGLERVGRELASEHHVAWKEYWSFLEDYVNFTNTDGLNKLEEFLKKRFEENLKNSPDLEKTLVCLSRMHEMKIAIKFDDFCDQFKSLSLDSHESSDQEAEDNSKFATPPCSPLRVTTNESCESSDDDEMSLANDDIKEDLFIQGKTPSKVDFDVFNSLPSTIDINKYPFTYRWRHEMQLANKNINNFIRSSKNLPARKKLDL